MIPKAADLVTSRRTRSAQRLLLCFTLTLLPPVLGLLPAALRGQSQPSRSAKKQRAEEREDSFRRWLNEDVVYIISGPERSVFQKLKTIEEKEQFIEQFWYRRDPDLRTTSNEFKEEHYRRIAYANERFASGIPGWKTDRGRVYIIHGDPAEIEKHRSGESYQRPYHEGGGFTAVFPFEIWRYHHIEGIGSDVELEFVDPSGSGEFRLAMNPWEKDAFLFTPGTGLTTAESLGLASRDQRSYFQPYARDLYPGMGHRAKDDPFTRYITRARIQQPKAIKYKDLKQIVDVRVGYDNLPYQVGMDYFRLNEDSVLVPITFELENRHLTFKQEGEMFVARVAVYAIITSITHRVIKEFDDDLMISYKPEYLKAGRMGRSVYQKVIPLDRKMRYRLDLVLKDLGSDSVGGTRKAIIPPPYQTEKLGLSSVIFSDYVRSVGDSADPDEMFVIGDLKVRPSLSRVFTRGLPVALYLHVYGATLDQTTLEPALALRFRILRDGKQIKYWSEEHGESIQFKSGLRVVVLKNLHAETLPPARYDLEIEVEDQLSKQQVSISQRFRVKAVVPPVERAGSGR
ncbi:MAG: GWxTD domain-containing protein [Acidobacteriota bacterium]